MVVLAFVRVRMSKPYPCRPKAGIHEIGFTIKRNPFSSTTPECITPESVPEELSGIQEFTRHQIVHAHSIPADRFVGILVNKLVGQEEETRMQVPEVVHASDVNRQRCWMYTNKLLYSSIQPMRQNHEPNSDD